MFDVCCFDVLVCCVLLGVGSRLLVFVVGCSLFIGSLLLLCACCRLCCLLSVGCHLLLLYVVVCCPMLVVCLWLCVVLIL